MQRPTASKALAVLGLTLLLGQVVYLLVLLIRPLPPASDGDYRFPVLFFVLVQTTIAAIGSYGALRGRVVWIGSTAFVLVLSAMPLLLMVGSHMPWWALALVALPPACFVLSTVAGAWTPGSRGISRG
ncbi:MAG: hypothetical protein ACYC6T_17625 [Thermoleophilia bacterium]